MSARAAMKASAMETLQYCLVQWPIEEQVSIVRRSDIAEPEKLSVHAECTVSVGRQKYTGVIVGIGNKAAMEKLEENFLEDETSVAKSTKKRARQPSKKADRQPSKKADIHSESQGPKKPRKTAKRVKTWGPEKRIGNILSVQQPSPPPSPPAQQPSPPSPPAQQPPPPPSPPAQQPSPPSPPTQQPSPPPSPPAQQPSSPSPPAQQPSPPPSPSAQQPSPSAFLPQFHLHDLCDDWNLPPPQNTITLMQDDIMQLVHGQAKILENQAFLCKQLDGLEKKIDQAFPQSSTSTPFPRRTATPTSSQQLPAASHTPRTATPTASQQLPAASHTPRTATPTASQQLPAASHTPRTATPTASQQLPAASHTPRTATPTASQQLSAASHTPRTATPTASLAPSPAAPQTATSQLASVGLAKTPEFPLEDINDAQLISLEDASRRYHQLMNKNKISAIAVKLAKEVYFGDAVLQQCTPRGHDGLPALPHQRLDLLKRSLFELFPAYWSTPYCFEQKWALAQEAIAQTCKRLRQKQA